MEHKHTQPSSNSISQLDASGHITLDLTIPFKELVLGKKIGQGAFGIVSEARWGDENVAVKQLSLLNPTEKDKHEFKQEAALMFQIGAASQNVVRLYKITLQPFSMVMELMPNGNLFELLQLHREKGLPWDLRYRLARDITHGLQAIHKHGVLHRDLKSLNVLLDDRLRAKLTDFGLATTKTTSSHHSSVKGTPHWMAPEVVGGEQASEASDVYSLGMVLWELATHRQPYAGLNPMQVMFQIANKKLETIPEDCDPNLKEIILDCWSLSETRPKAIDISKRLQLKAENKPEEVSAVVVSSTLDSLTTAQVKAGPGYQDNIPTVVAQDVLDSLTTSHLKVAPAYQNTPAPDVPVIVASKVLASLTSVQLKDGPTYQNATHLPLEAEQASSPFSLKTSRNVQPQADSEKPKPKEQKTLPGFTMFQTAMGFYNVEQYKDALPHLLQAARKHYPVAFVYLGFMYAQGYGVEKDLTKSTSYYQQAQAYESWFIEEAEKDSAEAQLALGRYYHIAAGDKRDVKKAVSCYLRAADQGHALAQRFMGLCYENGIGGITANLETAADWYLRSAKQGNALAQYNMAKYSENGTGKVIKSAEQAKQWYIQAADQGLARALRDLGDSYLREENPYRYGIAVNLLRKASNLGNVSAHYDLGWCFENGKGVPQDLGEAWRLYTKAANQGNANAQYTLGLWAEKGNKVERQSNETAVSWYRKAAAQGLEIAQTSLDNLLKLNPSLAKSSSSFFSSSDSATPDIGGNKANSFSK